MKLEQCKRVDTWKQCEQRLLQIETENSNSPSGVWFRGLSKARWCLTTTLERRGVCAYPVADYWRLMLRIKPEVETFTGMTWEVPEWSEPNRQFDEHFRRSPAFGFMAHLRHHGFPSPLLDWSRSPYIAAYFSFKGRTTDDVAIYAFSETPNKTKSSKGGYPKICSHGGYNLRTHERHFRQQSAYTVCVQQDDATQPWKFVSHEKIFKFAVEGQDLLYKTTVPASERGNVLRSLDRYNLNDFSLFGSEEALMNTLAFREIDLKQK